MELPGISQVQFVVNDLEKATEFYEKAFGWGPWQISKNKDLKHFEYYGKKANAVAHGAVFPDPAKGDYDGRMRIELTEVVAGDSVANDFIKKHGTGVHCIQIAVTNMEEVLKQVTENGCEVVYKGTIENPDYGIQVNVASIVHEVFGSVAYNLVEIKKL